MLKNILKISFVIGALILGFGYSNQGLAADTKLKTFSPENIEKLKEKAKERKRFYDEQARFKRELRERHNTEIHQLKAKHREERVSFFGNSDSQKKTQVDRKSFFQNQRNEMSELRKKQKKEAFDLKEQLKLKRAEL